MNKNAFRTLINPKIKEMSIHYILKLRIKREKYIIYTNIQTAYYLMSNQIFNISDKKLLFAVRNETYNLIDSFEKGK